jgi:hypothetical protein
MFKQALTILLVACAFLGMGFTGRKSNPEKWKATLRLEGTGKEIVLVSGAVYGGFNPAGKKFFFFGKQHMFLSPDSPEMAKIYSDLCVTNSAQQFQFELNGVPEVAAPSKAQTLQGNILFKKKFPISGTFRKNAGNGAREIAVRGNLTTLGLVLTEEARAVMTGKFELIFTETP